MRIKSNDHEIPEKESENANSEDKKERDKKNYRRNKERISLGGKRKKRINDEPLKAQSNEAVKQSSPRFRKQLVT